MSNLKYVRNARNLAKGRLSARNNMGTDIDMGDINKRHLCFVKQDRLKNLFPKISHILSMRFRFLLSVILKNEELI